MYVDTAGMVTLPMTFLSNTPIDCTIHHSLWPTNFTNKGSHTLQWASDSTQSIVQKILHLLYLPGLACDEISAVKRSIGFTIGLHNHGEGHKVLSRFIRGESCSSIEMLNINLSRISPDLLCWKTLVRPRCVGGRIERMKVKEDSSFTTSQRHGVTARDTWQQHITWHVTTVYRILRGADDWISSAPSHQLVNRVEGSRVRGYLYTLPLI